MTLGQAFIKAFEFLNDDILPFVFLQLSVVDSARAFTYISPKRRKGL
jgi:hypothetical protein